MLARISPLVHTGLVSISRELAADLAGAYLNRVNIHDDLCRGPGCSCGVDSLLTGLVDALLPGFADTAKDLGLEGKPFWAEEHPELFQHTPTAAAMSAAAVN